MPQSPAPRVRLRDVTLADADRYDALDGLERAGGGFNDFGVPPEPVDRNALVRGPLRNASNGIFLVERVADAVVIGRIGWHLERYGPNEASNACNIGIELVPEARGQGYGAEAQRLLARWLFEHTTVNRVEAATDIENLAEQRSLEMAGSTREGIVRGAQFRAGAYHDLVVYSRLRSDP